jgi:hypothetical protein
VGLCHKKRIAQRCAMQRAGLQNGGFSLQMAQNILLRLPEERFLKAKMQRLLVGVAILAVATGIAFGLAKGLRQEPPKREIDNRALLVDVLQLETLSAQLAVRSQGTVLPRTQTTLGAEIAGAIVEISPKFIPGGVFRAGEVLLRIDATDYEVAVHQADALVRQRKIEFEGAAKLRQQGYRAETEYASAAAALASAEAELVRAKAWCSARKPISDSSYRRERVSASRLPPIMPKCACP